MVIVINPAFALEIPHLKKNRKAASLSPCCITLSTQVLLVEVESCDTIKAAGEMLAQSCIVFWGVSGPPQPFQGFRWVLHRHCCTPFFLHAAEQVPALDPSARQIPS